MDTNWVSFKKKSHSFSVILTSSFSSQQVSKIKIFYLVVIVSPTKTCHPEKNTSGNPGKPHYHPVQFRGNLP
jgi:hypothetical protein